MAITAPLQRTADALEEATVFFLAALRLPPTSGQIIQEDLDKFDSAITTAQSVVTKYTKAEGTSA